MFSAFTLEVRTMNKLNCFLCAALLGLLAQHSVTFAATDGVDLNTKDIKAGGTPVGDLIRIPVKRVAITDTVFYVSALANVFMVNTPESATRSR